MLHIIIPHRNRPISYLKKALDTIVPQLNNLAIVTVVDYGSNHQLQQEIAALLQPLSRVDFISCPTQYQLWNKSRCINMILKKTTASFLMVADVDMLWHPDFIKVEQEKWLPHLVNYYLVGIMTRQESERIKDFSDADIKFITDREATGISVFPVKLLKDINGFDEFYHGWGSEDTDAHERCKNAGYEVRFRESEVFFKHQWHEKSYRNTSSKLPFHPFLERINAQYLNQVITNKVVRANDNTSWGKPCEPDDYKALNSPDHYIKINATYEEVKALLASLKNQQGLVFQIEIHRHPDAHTLKTMVKKRLKKKTPLFISLDLVNQMFLEEIVLNYRNCPYTYLYDMKDHIITCTLKL